MCVAADSNCLVEMQSERLATDDGSDGPTASAILEHTYFALDLGETCLNEACQCVQGVRSEELRQWVIRLQNDGKLRLLELPKDRRLKELLLRSGLPRADVKWALLASHECVQYVLTEDIDFYDPSAKCAPAAKKDRIKDNRAGRMLRVIRVQTGADVISLRHVSREFP